MARARTINFEAPHGAARIHLQPADSPVAAIVIGHGAGGGVDAPDIAAVAKMARAAGVTVALVEQPYRVAGRKSPAPAKQLDANWIAIIEHLQAGPLEGLPLIVGGRSMGSRVACRTAGEVGADAVLCLAFPLEPPRRASGAEAPSRLPELEAVKVPVLIVQGEKDPFGMPPKGRRRKVAVVAGNHGLKSDLPAVVEAVESWLPTVVPVPAAT